MGIKKYRVKGILITDYEIDVEARNKKEAIEIANDLNSDAWDSFEVVDEKIKKVEIVGLAY